MKRQHLEVFDIHRSCYYTCRERRKRVDVQRVILKAKVNQVFKKSRGAAGSRTIKSMLNEAGVEIGRYRVSRLMEEIGQTRFGVVISRISGLAADGHIWLWCLIYVPAAWSVGHFRTDLMLI